MTNVPLPPAPGTAEHLCLALANSIVTLPGGQRVDELNSPEDATAWLVGHNLAPEGTGLLSYCQNQLAGLREQLREILRSHTECTAPAPEALAGLNHALTAVPSAAPLHYSPGAGLSRVPSHPVSQIVAHAMAQIAEDAAALLTGPDAGRIAQCAAAPCDRFMVRTHARRQWCSERCGARQRATRSYARKVDKAPAG
ncbi:ABATE domain-containing protein [Arthrobacter sp. Sa2CUA1]|uniref:ABATE domain-containing protein n=1 Tax=Arthrobacter gallicola TaxID=2762225 RepID=A0ABR8UUZ0_9MICC|nr:CGNR zinc finger domain-containing protein [Arthrobacter gallicola]MBD7996195.1 ABATE domain-containing protein [Arthrobacter gallicola]